MITARDARLEKIESEERSQIKAHRARVAAQRATLQVEINRCRSLERQALALDLIETAALYRAEAEVAEAHMLVITGER